jgi:hypothetical protein
MTQIPWFDKLWYKNAFTTAFRRTTGLTILKIVGECIADRRQRNEHNGAANNDMTNGRDMLSRFFEIQAKNPTIPPWYGVFLPTLFAPLHHIRNQTKWM